MKTSTTYKIRPAGRHILTIGRDLIQDNYAAVFELVKNAYDADSPDVHIEFKTSPNSSGYSIAISDHGHGMSTDDVINKWLVPSTQDKIKRHRSPSGRTLQGSKGVGRYAASILGTDMLLETVNAKGQKTTAYLEWDDFEAALYLDDVEIPLETEAVSEASGTRLTINGGNEMLAEWDQKQFDKLRFELKKLTSPIIDSFNNEGTSEAFHISLRVNGFPGVNDINETVEPYPLFDLFDYKIAGKIHKDGTGTLIYSSQKARNTIEEKIPFNVGHPTGCGELDIDIRVYDREADAIDALIKRGFRDEFGRYVQKLEARQILNASNGIGVYRNGFRIRPLGDPDFDWLKLNARRVQNPTRCIGSNQTIGYVQIQSEDQSHLIEKSARDGLKENAAFNQLKEITTQVITELEWRRFNYRKSAGLSRPAFKVESNLQNLFSFDELKQDIETELTKAAVDRITTDEIIKRISEDAEDKNKIAEEIRETVAVYQSQITLGKITNVLLHEARRPLSYFRNRIPYLKRRYDSFQKNGNPADLEKAMETVDGIAENSQFFVNLFKRLDSLAARKQTIKKPLALQKTIEDVFSVFENEMKSHNISTEIKGSDEFRFLARHQDIYAIFTNLVDNSLYWISEKKPETREITIEFLVDEGSLIHIDYHDTGPGIEPTLIESEVIFEPHFSTKPDGTGLGLAIAAEAADRSGLELKVFESEEGAHFRLLPKMEGEREKIAVTYR